MSMNDTSTLRTTDSDVTNATIVSVDTVVTASSVLRGYYELTKPGISQMVALSTLAGYYLAVPGNIVAYMSEMSNAMHLVATMVGTLAISSGSCAINHVLEREDDARMKRTATRPIPSGSISPLAATVFGVALTLGGASLLWTINTLTFVLALVTWVSYIAVYTPMKKRSSLAVLVGGIPGALPFAGGWTAVQGSLGAPAIALFAILFFWQLPHFYALSWMYRADYRTAGFVLRSLRDESHRTLGRQMVLTSVLTMIAAVVPTLLGTTGWLYGAGSLLLGGWLVVESYRFLKSGEHSAARRVLLTSYAVLMGVFVLMFLDKA